MKKFIPFVLSVLLFSPVIALAASAAVWQINNPTDTGILPSKVNNVVKGILVTASSTVGDTTQAGGLTISGGATTTGNAYFGGAVIAGTPIFLQQFGSSVPVLQAEGGDVNFGDEANSGRTMFFRRNAATRGGISTINAQLSIFGGASPTTLNSNTLNLTANNSMGFGTSTPMAKFAIAANTDVSSPNNLLFAIGSSTATATTTLFSIANNGFVSIGAPNPGAQSLFRIQQPSISDVPTPTSMMDVHALNASPWLARRARLRAADHIG